MQNRAKNRFKRKRPLARQLRIGLLAFFMLLLTTSCGRDPEAADSNVQVWVPEFLPLEMEADTYGSMAFWGNAFYYISHERQGDGFRYRLSGYSLADGSLEDGSLADGSLDDSSPNGGSLADIPLRWPDGRDRFVTSLFAMDEDGCFYLLAYVTENDSSRLHLCKFDAEGKLMYDVDISGETDSPELLAVDGQGRAYIAGRVSDSPCIWLYTPEGAYRGSLSPAISNGSISAMGRAGNGAVYACCRGNSGGEEAYVLTELDFDKGKAGDASPDFPKGDNSILVPGPGNSLLSFDRTSVYAYDLAAQTSEVLFDWLDQDINGSYVTAVHVTEEGAILAVVRDFAKESCELALLKKADSAQTAKKNTIVLGTLYSNSTLRNAVIAFNRGNDKYHVKIKEYLDPQTHDQADAAGRMNADILSDNCPDILDLADLDLNALASKGLFADLNTFLESSSLLDRGDFLDNLLDAYTVDSKLITIPSCFSLKTVFGWRADVGESSGWTLDELIDYADAHPEAELFDNTSRNEIMQYLMSYNQDAFIDWSLGECRFESDAFIRLLEFVSRFPEADQSGSERSSTPVRIRNGEVLLLTEDISDFNSIQMPLAVYGNEGTCIGFPSADGSAGCMLIPYGAYAVTVKSDHKEGAWAFIESILASEENGSSFFPSRKSVLAKKAADAVMPASSDAGMAVFYSDWEYTYHTPTREEVDLTLALIETAKPVSLTDANEVINIINEEAQGYYQGQKTAPEAAKIIQSRVWIYVNED